MADVAEKVERKPRTLPADTGDITEAREIGGDSNEGGEGEAAAPEDAIAKAAAAAKNKDAELAAERSRRESAEDEAQKANVGAYNANAARAADREAFLTTHIATQEAALKSARDKIKTAMEAADGEALADAQEELTQARMQLTGAQNELGQVKAYRERIAKTPPPQAADGTRAAAAAGPSADSQAWIDAHPRFEVDPDYHASVVTAHNAWIARGKASTVGSKEYVEFIDTRMAAKYGANHGEIKTVDTTQRQDTRRGSSTAAPPSRGDGGGIGAGNNRGMTVKHDASMGGGEITLLGFTEKGDPKLRGRIPPEWREAARICNMSEEAYAAEQIQISAEARSGGDTGLRFGDSSGVYK